MNSIDPLLIQQVKDGVVQLGNLVEQLSQIDRTPDMSAIPNSGISGNKIHGGTITKFSSVGIKDDSSRLVVVVDDNGILTDYIDVETLVGDTIVDGNLDVKGEIRAKKLHIDELTSDIRQERSASLDFHPDESGNIYNKGLYWISESGTKQFVLKNNPDRLWSSLSVDVPASEGYLIGGQQVITSDSLGSSIRNSKLKSVGTLDKLYVQGELNLSQFVFWDPGVGRFSIGTETPNARFSVAGWDQEFVVDVDERSTKIGNYTTHNLEIVTDDTPRISIEANGKVNFGFKGTDSARVNVHGKLGIGVNNVDDDVCLSTSGPIKIQNKKFMINSSSPNSGSYRKGDIVWNSNPNPTGYVGWICVREGTPGEWKSFGQISA